MCLRTFVVFVVRLYMASVHLFKIICDRYAIATHVDNIITTMLISVLVHSLAHVCNGDCYHVYRAILCSRIKLFLVGFPNRILQDSAHEFGQVYLQ